MQLVRGCLMTLGLIMLLMITSCVVGVSGCSRVMNPTQYGRTIDEEQDKTRRMVRDFLDSATYEPAESIEVRGKPLIVKVQDYSDGSVHLTAMQDRGPLLDIAVTFKPIDTDQTRIEVVADGDKLADALGMRPHLIHRAIKNDLDETFSAIDQHRVLPHGLLLSRVIKQAREERRW